MGENHPWVLTIHSTADRPLYHVYVFSFCLVPWEKKILSLLCIFPLPLLPPLCAFDIRKTGMLRLRETRLIEVVRLQFGLRAVVVL